MDAVGGDFHLGDPAEGEQKFHEVFGRLLGSLFDDVGNGVGDGRLEGYAAGVEAGEVYANELPGLEDRAHMRMFALGGEKCKAGSRVRIGRG